MSTLGENLKKLRKAKKMTQKVLAQKSGVKQSVISELETGIAKSTGSIVELATALGVSSEELKFGRLSKEELEKANITQITAWDDTTPLDEDDVAVPFFKDFSFACGSGSIGEAMLNEKRRLRLSKATLRNLGIQADNTCAASASGNSMSPTINDGDTVHIDTNRTTIKDGKVFALCHGGLFLIKRLYNLPMGGVRIVSDNAIEFPEVHLTAQEIQEQQFEVLGWVWQVSSLDFW